MREDDEKGKGVRDSFRYAELLLMTNLGLVEAATKVT